MTALVNIYVCMIFKCQVLFLPAAEPSKPLHFRDADHQVLRRVAKTKQPLEHAASSESCCQLT